MIKFLDKKLSKIKKENFIKKDFILADAKDADMGVGRRAPGFTREKNGKVTNKPASFQTYLEKMKKMTKSKLVDIMLMSTTSAERLIKKGIFKNSPVTPAIRLNDTSCIWGMIRHGQYDKHKSKHFATVRLRHAKKLVDLGLYSLTFNKNIDLDIAMLNAYRNFRNEAELIGMRYFLEVFNSSVIKLNTKEMGQYVNDCILRSLAGQITKEKPLFLKIAYNGPAAMEELASYDPGNLIIGVLGGSKGTTRDTFELVYQAEKYGAKVALFGRKINLSEDQKSIVTCMRKVVEGDISPSEGVKFYHDLLSKKNIIPDRNLKDDLNISDTVLLN